MELVVLTSFLCLKRLVFNDARFLFTQPLTIPSHKERKMGTRKFDGIARRPYKDARQDIRTGDIFLVKCSRLKFSWR